MRGDTERISAAVEKLKSAGLFVSIFIDPDPDQISASAQTGAHMVEIHTGSYANARDETEMTMELDKIRKSAEDALSHRLRVSAGHGLNYANGTQYRSQHNFTGGFLGNGKSRKRHDLPAIVFLL